MSKNWYPMINYEKCVECGACIDMCQHGVYSKERAPRPVVVYPEGCIEGCKGCGSLCPNEAIGYFGDEVACSAGGCDCSGGCACKG
ncbi:MAG: NADH-plastoquinone oxidoreductase subunit [Firmicutes bacterium ADurb.Bin182]|nr:MAG: NADH-plastoquinone oxidoreductase subunit [Firmicutes bacterium ADurb.Bin182]